MPHILQIPVTREELVEVATDRGKPRKPRKPRGDGDGKFDESEHPRGSKGTSQGGKFVSKKGGASQEDKDAVRAAFDGAGAKTLKQRIKEYQEEHGLQVDGVVGRQTATALLGHTKKAKNTKAGEMDDSLAERLRKKFGRAKKSVVSDGMSELFASHVAKAVAAANGVTLMEKAADLSALDDETLLAARDLFAQLNDSQGVKAVKAEMESRGEAAPEAEQNPQQWLANQITGDLVAWYKLGEQANASKACKLIKKELDRRGVDPDAAADEELPADDTSLDEPPPEAY